MRNKKFDQKIRPKFCIVKRLMKGWLMVNYRENLYERRNVLDLNDIS